MRRVSERRRVCIYSLSERRERECAAGIGLDRQRRNQGLDSRKTASKAEAAELCECEAAGAVIEIIGLAQCLCGDGCVCTPTEQAKARLQLVLQAAGRGVLPRLRLQTKRVAGVRRPLLLPFMADGSRLRPTGDDGTPPLPPGRQPPHLVPGARHPGLRPTFHKAPSGSLSRSSIPRNHVLR
ncbi:hypothetical protein DPX16_14819 [Anabarilius grahami]|uniref:Uncharacterized protein n=1 Tax=Anabarilius grahami TaxID=495550 RepID=A0A3N0YA82_ANAGA|nr:hypothetical protein DPX16_14819 [Anabarilius grahami]